MKKNINYFQNIIYTAFYVFCFFHIEASNIVKNIALVGLGPHAKRIYYPYLEKIKNINLELLVDLDCNKENVLKYIQLRELKPKKILFLNSANQIKPSFISEEVLSYLQKGIITHGILSSEPKSHKIYLEAFIKSKIPILVDKPITIFDELTYDNVIQLEKDIEYLSDLIKQNDASRVLIQCQRRNHEGYIYIKNLINNIIDNYNIPITYINIHHSDGMWNMPEEFKFRENHPYKYGYGKLAHSGYHFIDLLTLLLSLNLTIKDKKPDVLSIFSQSIRPFDHSVVINKEDYQKLLGIGNYESEFLNNNYYGELDNYSQLQLLKSNKIITSVQMSLMQSGLSQRGWKNLPFDTYKGNGRIRHESINIHIGPLFNIQIHSYQSIEINQNDIYDNIGSKNHFDIYIFKNTNLLGGSPLEIIKFGQIDEKKNNNIQYLGHNEAARYTIIDELLYEKESNSELTSHIASVKLLSKLYLNRIKENNNEIPFSKYKIEEIFDE